MPNDITQKDPNDFSSIRLRLASPEDIKSWSYGEVTKPETINYRTQRSEKNGLFDEKIFGPDKDYECYCGKYRGVRYKGIVCEKCGVEITRSIVRRERMGHIELATPVSHIWFLRGMPSRIATILGISSSDVEKVVYFSGYIVTSVNEDERQRVLKDLDSEFKAKIKSAQTDEEKENIQELMQNARRDIELIRERTVLDEVKYHNFSVRYGSMFEAGIGAETIYEMLRKVDLAALEEELKGKLESGEADAPKTTKRLALVRAMLNAEQRPEWMFLTHIPVIPPAMRPMVPLDGGRFATSDVNDLYRRVINRNTRLKKLKEIHAPDVILRNEKRILQEAVDALLDNSARQGQTSPQTSQAQKRPLKSVADNLKGKRGLFRQNLLGKRVDYSGRSVIVVGPTLALDQCGLPKHMALELFKPFVISHLLKQELAYNIRGASRLIEEGIPEVWAILEDVIKDKYVLLNRAPTLHRLGIQAFRPMLIEGNAIQIHPLVCSAFNADFDGDQMAVHVPLSKEAQLEAKEIMAADKNIFKPGSGDPIIAAKLDIILGCYWMTKIIEGDKGEGKYFESPEEVMMALDWGVIGMRSKVHVLPPDTEKYAQFEGKLFETTAGRILLNNILPESYPFLNEEVERKRMSRLVNDLIEKYGNTAIPPIVDRIKTFGFDSATRAGITWGIDEVVVPEEKQEVIQRATEKDAAVEGQYEAGLLSREERMRKNVEIWLEAKNEIESLIPKTLSSKDSLYDMWKSGARASLNQITQMAGMKGLIQTTGGGTIEFPVLTSMKEGLTPIEYFTTTHGSRKGLSDTALKTAQSGYLTRRLFDVAQDSIVSEEDCGTKQGIPIRAASASGMEGTMARHIVGRFLVEDAKDSDGNTVFKKGHYLSRQDAEAVQNAGAEMVRVRSPLTCEAARGICQACYGHDFGRGQLVELGEAVGTVAAQAIGEPGTQLTMRTFHAGGAATAAGDITQGLPRVEEVFEKRKPKSPAVVSHVDGVVSEIKHTGKEHVISILPSAEYAKKGSKEKTIEYSCDSIRTVLVRQGDEVKKGAWLTDGSADIDELFKGISKEYAQEYIISEIIKLYELQGESVSRKHIELIVRQMFSRRRIVDPKGTTLSSGVVVEQAMLDKANQEAVEQGKEEATSTLALMGITDVSLSRQSFLSAASFQHTTRVLIDAAVRGARDPLEGLKENVILGRLIPAGTGFEGSPKAEMIKEAQK